MGNWVGSSYNSADEFLVSGWPWVKSGDLPQSSGPTNNIAEVEFDRTTRFIVIHNSGDFPVQVAFANQPAQVVPNPLPSGKVADDYRAMGFHTVGTSEQLFFVVQPRETTPRLEVKCKNLYLRAVGGASSYSVAAGLTNVPRNKFPDFESNRATFQGV